MKFCPSTGGDTLFASAFEAYDLLSSPMQRMLEDLKATFTPPNHRPENVVGRLWPGTRGAPENRGPELRASHPCVRTHPVTGWKSLYAVGHHLEGIEGLGDVENRMMLEFLQRLITENHQLQARVKWNAGDMVIWDNRSVYHVSSLHRYDYMKAIQLTNRTSSSVLRTTMALRVYVVLIEFAGVVRCLTWTLSLLDVGMYWVFKLSSKLTLVLVGFVTDELYFFFPV